MIRVSKCGVMHVRTKFMLQLYDFQTYRNILGMDKESSCMTVLNSQQIDRQNSTSDCSANSTSESTLIIFGLPSPLFVLCSWLPHQADLLPVSYYIVHNIIMFAKIMKAIHMQ